MLGNKVKKKQTSIFGFFKRKNEQLQENVERDLKSDASSHSEVKANQVESRTAQDDDQDESFLQPASKKMRSIVVIDSEESQDDSIRERDRDTYLPVAPPMTPLLKLKDNFAMKKHSDVFSTPTSKSVSKPSQSSQSLARFSSNNLSSATTPLSRGEKFKQKNEERYSWLLDIRDENQIPLGDPSYDPRTLYVPKSAWNSFTPFEKQFWEIKAKHWDTVVFFKKGKFFELFENDADLGHQQFDLKLVDRVNMRMVGVPESSFHHWASQFIAKGYKVAKVEQMENAVGKAIRDKKQTLKSKDDKIIRRELTCVLTTGTLVDGEFLTSDHCSFLMAIKEIQETGNPPSFGICFVDTATAEFNISFFTDDENRTQLETLITQTRPKELVLEKGLLSKESMKILRNNLDNTQYNFLTPIKEFWNCETTMEELSCNEYFKVAEMDSESGMENWPEAVQKASSNPLAISAFGALLFYLRTLRLDKSLLSANNIHIYDPVKSNSSLILDGQTLINLEIFNNSHDGSENGSLFKLLNNCATPFGKRLFRKWVCHPLQSISSINSRLDAIDDLSENKSLLEELRLKLRGLPDMERIISRIHSGNCLVKDFVSCLSGFQKSREILAFLADYNHSFKSTVLQSIVKNEAWSEEIVTCAQYLSNAFDHDDARTTGKIQLHEGYDADFDSLREKVTTVESKLEAYRKECERSLKFKIGFRDIGKEIFQFEVASKAKVPTDWTEVSKTQAVSRWYSAKLRNLVSELQECREMCEEGMREIKARLYQAFDQHYKSWMEVISNISHLDCLMGLSFCKANIGEPVCRPSFLKSPESILELEEMRHPCVTETVASEYIPNDLSLSGKKDAMVLLTGANMSGKSTLLRQTCIAVIMAQIGSYVPATSCRMTPVDRIFTRIGANDNIMAGQSTFMVELSETSKILKEATKRSLVILDELGRGTSTFDGYAIAYSVLYHLITHVGCLGLFSTHYGTLTNEFENHPLVALRYMSFFVDEESRKVTFLYKLVDGKCPQSYGMNVARKACIPESIIQRAEEIAKTFDENHSFKTASDKVIVDLQTLAAFETVFNGPIKEETLDRIQMIFS